MSFDFYGPQVETYTTSGQKTNYKETILTMLKTCAPPLPTKKAQRTRRMLQESEIHAIDLAHREMNAGDGWYFDGRSYVGPTGESRKRHPRLEEFLQEYLVEQNCEIDRYNNYVQARRTRSEVARMGEAEETEEDVLMYAEEEARRINGGVSIVTVGNASAIVSPAMKTRMGGSMETKEEGASLPSSSSVFKK